MAPPVSSPSPRPCDWPDCTAAGEHRAPCSASRVGSNRPEDYFWFCLHHVREYNKNWDFFSSMTDEEMLQFQKEAVIGHRPTWRREQTGIHRNREEQLQEAVDRFMGRTRPHQTGRAMPAKRYPKKILDAFDELDLTAASTPDDIRQRYRQLVKQLHPDATGGNKNSEERFKRVVTAYQHLKAYFAES